MSESVFGIYARVSTEDQAQGDKYSIPSQLKDGRALAGRERVTVVRDYVDDKKYRVGGRLVEPSARRADRPAWTQLLADADAGLIQGVIAWDHTRLYGDYRPATDFLECVERNKLRVLLVNDTFNSEFSMLNAWARRQWYKDHANRMRVGREARARLGLNPTGPVRFYTAIRDERGKTINFIFDEQYRFFFDELARRFLLGEPYDDMALFFQRHPVTGRHIDGTTMRVILHNPFYRGYIAYGQRVGEVAFVVKGKHGAAWDEETCAAIEAELQKRQIIGRRRTHGGRFLFSGVARCAICDHVLTGIPPARPHGKYYVSYQCSFGAKVRKGVRVGIPHANNISERKLLLQLQDKLQALERGDVDEYLDGYFWKPTVPLIREGETKRLEKQIEELRAEIETVKSTTARQALVTEQRRIEGELAKWEKASGAGIEPAQLDVERVREAMGVLIERPDLMEWEPEQLRPVLRMAFSLGLYVLGGEIMFQRPDSAG